MKQTAPKSAFFAWLWGAVLLATCTLNGVWHAQTPPPSLTGHAEACGASVSATPCDDPRMEEIERTLAQAGCPGWMVLASEGPQALGGEVVPSEFRGAATHSSDKSTMGTSNSGSPISPTGTAILTERDPGDWTMGVTQATHPAVIELAQKSPGEATFVPSQPEDPDDLLDGEPDLLWGQPSSESTAEEVDESDPSLSSQRDYDDLPVELPEVDLPRAQVDVPIIYVPETDDADQPQLGVPQVTPSEDAESDGPRDEALPPPSWLPQGHQIENPHLEMAPTQRSVPQQLPQAVPGPRTDHLPSPGPAQPATEQPLFGPPSAAPGSPAPHSVRSDVPTDMRNHCEFIADEMYPSAFTCAKCHENIFEEWAISSHAYASLSPMFHKFEQKINDLSQGTIGYFCYRCHSPVGTSLGISRGEPMWNVPQVVREGVTCVACHRVNQRYGKVNGERRIEPGNVFDPVYGSIGGDGVAEVIARKDHYKVKTSPHEKGPGQEMHVAGVYFEQLSKPEFCVSCHQVEVQPGIKLEVVWEQYRASPACKKGISCQDCHMGRIPGVPSGYETAPAAVVNGKEVDPHRKHANHTFFGPGYSIAHPGVFPHNKDALRWSVKDWLEFDWRAGWGTKEFERQVEQGQILVHFPPVWTEVDDRMDAREVMDDNLKKLNRKRESRIQVLENGSHVDGPFFDRPPRAGSDLRFHYVMVNTNEGHNLPSGSLGAQPQIWANVVLIGPRGQRLWESGYTDRWGDVADIHSEDVQNKRIPFDSQLFNLQTMFLITGAKGTDREFFLPINVDIDQLPYLRPGAQPISVINHPPFIRMEGRSLPPLGSRRIPYRVPAELMREPGCYRISFRLRSRANPIYFMKFCDSTLEMQRSMNENMVDFHESSFEFHVH